MVMTKLKSKSVSVMAGLRADVNYQIAVRVNKVVENVSKVSKELLKLKEIIALDMKKWSKQRSDMQCDINRLARAIMRMQQGQNMDP